MLKTDFESQEKKPLYVSPTVKEINIVTSHCILQGSGDTTEDGDVTFVPKW